MIDKVKESFVSHVSDENDIFWSYYIIECPESGQKNRYNLIRIDNLCEKMECLGRELDLELCQNIILDNEKSYPKNRRNYK